MPADPARPLSWLTGSARRVTRLGHFPGPSAEALLLIPPAVASGLGELGKHGSMISRHFGSGVRLAGVTTDMPLIATTRAPFGGDEFCMTCQACTRACPADAISEKKQMVRGVERCMWTSTNAFRPSPTSPAVRCASPNAHGLDPRRGRGYWQRWRRMRQTEGVEPTAEAVAGERHHQRIKCRDQQ